MTHLFKLKIRQLRHLLGSVLDMLRKKDGINLGTEDAGCKRGDDWTNMVSERDTDLGCLRREWLKTSFSLCLFRHGILTCPQSWFYNCLPQFSLLYSLFCPKWNSPNFIFRLLAFLRKKILWSLVINHWPEGQLESPFIEHAISRIN